MGEVVELAPRLRQREYVRYWDEAVDGKPGAVGRLRLLMALDADFRAYCVARYRAHIAEVDARRYGEEDGA